MGKVSERRQNASRGRRENYDSPRARFLASNFGGAMFTVRGIWMVSGFQKLLREAVVCSGVPTSDKVL